MSDAHAGEGDGLKVRFERSGGFAGMTLTREVDAAKLPPDEARRLRELVDGAGFFTLPASGPPARGPDRFQYVVEVEQGGRRHSVRAGDDAPEALQPLLEYLTRLARRPEGGG